MSYGTALVVGVGTETGLGAGLARCLARERFRVVIAGRTEARLHAVAAPIRSAGGGGVIKVADASREADVVTLFDGAAGGNDLDLVIYNVGNNFAAPALETQAKLFEDLWRQNALGGFLVGREAVRRLAPRNRGTILFTGATASLRARPPFLAFAAAKAALHAVAQGLAREFGPQGLHVAHIVIDGALGRAAHVGDYKADTRIEFARMPLDLGGHPARLRPASGGEIRVTPQVCRMAAVDPTRRHSHARNSYSNCYVGKRDMVLTLTLEHLALGNGLEGLNSQPNFCASASVRWTRSAENRPPIPDCRPLVRVFTQSGPFAEVRLRVLDDGS